MCNCPCQAISYKPNNERQAVFLSRLIHIQTVIAKDIKPVSNGTLHGGPVVLGHGTQNLIVPRKIKGKHWSRRKLAQTGSKGSSVVWKNV